MNLFAILDDAVPDTFFVIEDVPSPSLPVCIVDSVERGRIAPSDPSVHVAVSTTSSFYCCPICLKSFKSSCSSLPPSLWQHLNTSHIAKGQFPPISFIISYSQLICDKKGCHWIYIIAVSNAMVVQDLLTMGPVNAVVLWFVLPL